MNMKTIKTFGFAVLIASALIACNSSAPAENTVVEEGISGTFNADAGASVINWEGNMVGMYNHTGTLAISNGSLTLENEAITGGEFTVDMTSMKTTDANYDSAAGHTSDKLVGHLSAGDFFLVDSFPTASFKITGADSTGVTGDLTIKGMTNSEKISNVVVEKTDNGVNVKGDLTFDRTKYNVTYQNELKDKVLSNDIKLNIEVVAQP